MLRTRSFVASAPVAHSVSWQPLAASSCVMRRTSLSANGNAARPPRLEGMGQGLPTKIFLLVALRRSANRRAAWAMRSDGLRRMANDSTRKRLLASMSAAHGTMKSCWCGMIRTSPVGGSAPATGFSSRSYMAPSLAVSESSFTDTLPRVTSPATPHQLPLAPAKASRASSGMAWTWYSLSRLRLVAWNWSSSPASDSTHDQIAAGSTSLASTIEKKSTVQRSARASACRLAHDTWEPLSWSPLCGWRRWARARPLPRSAAHSASWGLSAKTRRRWSWV
eukprot:1468687-Rhodomonas_salina.2